MKYFKLSEFETNNQKITDKNIQRNIESLVDNVLDKVRAYYGKAIYVIEGYNPSSKHDGHSIGIAADITTKNKQGNINIFEYIKTLKFDELSVVGDYDSIHVAYYPSNKQTVVEAVAEENFMSDYIVCLESGHGKDVVGKRSPDGKLLEWEWAREVKYMLAESLEKNKIALCFDVNPETTEPGLTTRANRANAVHKKNNNKSIFVSIHLNAAGNDGQWKNAQYWSIWTSKGQTEADKLAEDIWQEANKYFTVDNRKVGSDMSDGDHDYEANFTVLVKTVMPAVLIENFFQDNKENAQYLLSDKGKQDAVNVLTEGIKRYLLKKK